MCRICREPVEDLVNLTTLDCSWCPSLVSVSKELVNLTTLYCSGCPLLVSVPKELVNLTTLYCYWCPWLTQNVAVYPNHLLSLLRLQRWSRRGLKGARLLRWMRTRAFNEWFWSPSEIGGQMMKCSLERVFTSAKLKRCRTDAETDAPPAKHARIE